MSEVTEQLENRVLPPLEHWAKAQANWPAYRAKHGKIPTLHDLLISVYVQGLLDGAVAQDSNPQDISQIKHLTSQADEEA